jgi:pimeloyl-ACP methyl ester carboxylesterase
MARIVLVHGAFGGAWNWEGIAGRLEAAGHRVQTLDLPGAGADHTPVEEITLAAYAQRVGEVLASDPEPAMLVGHSMGGVVVTQAASDHPGRVARLVYVCAFMPSDGQSLLDLTQLPEGADDQIQANIVVEGDPPVAHLSAEATRQAVYNCCTDEQAEYGVSRRRPQPVIPFTTPVSVDDATLAAFPRGYVLCERDHSIPPALQRRMVEEHPCEAGVVTIDTDHAPFLSRADELLAALEGFARGAA